MKVFEVKENLTKLYEELVKNINEATNRSLEIFESNPRGAIKSINESKEISDIQLHIVDQLKDKVAKEYLANFNELQKGLEGFMLDFDEKNSKFNEFINAFNLNKLLKPLEILNNQVCGSESLNCANTCGGPGCNKCGGSFLDYEYHSSVAVAENECKDSMQFMYIKYKSMYNTFNETVKSKSEEYKQIFKNWAKTEQSIDEMKFNINEIYQWLLENNATIAQRLQSTRNVLDLIEKMKIDHTILNNKINQNCDKVIGMRLEDENKFSSLVEQINKYIPDLKDKIANIAVETQQSKEKADKIKDKVDDLEDIFKKDMKAVDAKKQLIEKERNKSQAINDQIAALVITKEEISENSLSAESNYAKVKEKIEESKILKASYYASLGVESLKVSVKEDDISHVENKLDVVWDKLEKADIINEYYEKLMNKSGSNVEIFNEIKKLTNDINEKNKGLEERKQVLEASKEVAKQNKQIFENQKQELRSLIERAKELKTSLIDKSKYFLSCK